MDSLKKLEWVDYLIDHLHKNDWQSNVDVIKVLGDVGDAKALEPLLEMKEKLSWNYVDVNTNLNFMDFNSTLCNIKEIVDDAIEKIKKNTAEDDEDTVCGKCICRYQLRECKTGFFSSFEYYSCPSCHSNMYKENGVDRIQLILDRTLEEYSSRQGEILVVNWFKFKKSFDYDEIVIQSANDFDVEELVMKLLDDKNEKRRNRMKKIPVYVKPKVELSMSKINLLKDHFKFEA